MRNLLYLFVFAALLLGLSACSSYYYSMLNSNDPVGRRMREVILCRKTIRYVSLIVSGERTPRLLLPFIINWMNLYVDWGRSALIIDDVATTYDPKVASVRGESSSVASGSSFHWSDRSSSGWSYSEGSFSGDVSLPKGVEFIPPHSKLVNTPLQLANFPFNEIPKEEYVKEQMTTKANTTVNIRVKDFTEEDSSAEIP